MMHGFTENYIRVGTRYDPLMINELCRIKITTINEAGIAVGEDAQIDSSLTSLVAS